MTRGKMINPLHRGTWSAFVLAPVRSVALSIGSASSAANHGNGSVEIVTRLGPAHCLREEITVRRDQSLRPASTGCHMASGFAPTGGKCCSTRNTAPFGSAIQAPPLLVPTSRNGSPPAQVKAGTDRSAEAEGAGS
jgi:hypothetical protein